MVAQVAPHVARSSVDTCGHLMDWTSKGSLRMARSPGTQRGLVTRAHSCALSTLLVSGYPDFLPGHMLPKAGIPRETSREAARLCLS